VFEAAPWERAQAIVRCHVRRREVLCVRGRHRRGAGRHAERLEDALRDEIVPRRAGGFARGFARGEIHHVLIAEARSETPRRFEIADAAKYFVARDAGAEPYELAAGKSAAMGQRVAHRELGARVWIEETEAGEVVGEVRVPTHFAVTDEHGDQGGGERF